MERAQRQNCEQDDSRSGGKSQSKPVSLTDILLLDPPSRAANALSRYQTGKSHYIDGFNNPVLPCSALDAPALGDLVWRVAAALRILSRPEKPFDTDQFDILLDAAATAVSGAMAAPADIAAEQLASVLFQEQRLGDDALVGLFRLGEAPLAEALIAAQADLRPVMVRQFLYEAGGERFAVLARFIGLSSDGLASIHAMTRSGGAGLFLPDGPDEGNPVALFAKIDAVDARRMVQYWSLSPEYQLALTALKQA